MVRVPLWIYGAALAMKFGVNFAHLARWKQALRSQGVALPTWQGLRLLLIGSFLDLFLPGTIGGDAFRAFNTRRSSSLMHSAAIVFMERYCGVLATLLMGVAAVSVSRYPREHVWLSLSILALFLLHVAVLVVGASMRVSFAARKLAVRLGASKVATWVTLGSGSLRQLLKAPRLFAGMLGFSVLMRAGFGGQLYLLAVGLGLEMRVSDLLVFLSLNAVVTALPISINGLGVREANLFAFFTYMGSTPTEAGSLAFLLAVWTYVSRLPGGLLLLLGSAESRLAGSEAEQ
jgi:hypothetical protein